MHFSVIGCAGFIGFTEAKFDYHMTDKWECKVLNVESQI